MLLEIAASSFSTAWSTTKNSTMRSIHPTATLLGLKQQSAEIQYVVPIKKNTKYKEDDRREPH